MSLTPRDPRTVLVAEEARQRETLQSLSRVTTSRATLARLRSDRTRKEATSKRRLTVADPEVQAERVARSLALSAVQAWCDRPVNDEFGHYRRHEALLAAGSPVAHTSGAPQRGDQNAPVVLLPIRIETRFVADATDPADPPRKVLRCRIYPDEVAADSFEPRLRVWTDEASAGRSEEADGVAYWTRVKGTESVLWAAIDSVDALHKGIDGTYASGAVLAWYVARRDEATIRIAWEVYTAAVATWHGGAGTAAGALRGVKAAGARDWPLVRPSDDSGAPTEAERVVGDAFWGVLDADEAAAWQALLTQGYSARRAAWIVRATQPGSTPDRRTLDWLRPAEASCLPDRWVVLGYQRRASSNSAGELVELFRVPTAAVRQPLAVSLSPSDTLARQDGEQLPADEDSAWTLEFERAVACGMAIEITEDSGHAPFKFVDGLDLLTVVGVRTSADPTSSATLLSDLLAHHRYTRGVELVLPDTPTNNTADTTAGYHSSSDRSGESLSYLRERRGLRPESGSDGQRLLAALGIDAAGQATLSDLTLPRGVSEYWAGVNTRLVMAPATIGYALRHLLHLADSRDFRIVSAMRWLATYVFPGGPLSSFRIGRNPYGVLPVIRRPSPPASDFTEPTSLEEVLGLLWPHWLKAAETIPHVGRAGAELDPEGELLGILSMEGLSASLDLRPCKWPDMLDHLPSSPDGLVTPSASWTPAVARTTWGRLTLAEIFAALFGEPDAVRVSESVLALLTRLFPGLRHRTVSAGRDFDLSQPWTTANDRFGFLSHPVLWQVCSDERPLKLTDAAWEGTLLSLRTAIYTRSATLLEEGRTGIVADASLRHIFRNLVDSGFKPRGDDVRNKAGVRHLDGPTFRRHCLQTIDACSHRLDAWITSLATHRLSQRSSGGCLIGGYGWVERLVPDTDRERASIGYIHAPSVNHAATAAILRNAHASEDSELASAFAIDLSSERVRRAQWLLDGVRQGQAIEELLGYEFERAMHEAKLDKWIEDIRRKYPLQGTILTADADPDRDADLGHPPHVVDGLALIDAWRGSAGHLPWARTAAERTEEAKRGIDWKDLNVPGEASATSIACLLRALDDSIDAVNDVLTAESVFQMVRGNRAGASAAMDVQSQGALAPDPEVLRTPVGGRLVYLRVVQPLATPSSTSAWGRSAAALMEPTIDAWIEGIVGSPTQYVARMVAVRSARVGDDDAPPAAVWIDLSRLARELEGSPAGGLSSIDLLSLSRRVSELEARFVALVWEDPAWQGWDVRVELEPTEAWPANARPVIDALEVGASAATLFGRARALSPDDLVAPGSTSPILVEDARVFAVRVREAHASARTLLNTGRETLPDRTDHLGDPPVAMTDRLDGETEVAWAERTPGSVAGWIARVRVWLDGGVDRVSARAIARALSEYGIGFARPCALRPAWDGASLSGRLAEVRRLGAESGRFADEVDGALDELGRRIASASEHVAKMESALGVGDASTTIAEGSAVVRALFGESFLVLPTFAAPASLASDRSLLTASTPVATASDLEGWTIDVARARPAVAAWQRLRLHTALPAAIDMISLGTSSTTWDRGPVPAIARPNEPVAPAAYVGWSGALPEGGRSISGILVDAWTETVPHDHVTTGLTFHYDDAGTEAPQTILIAVPPAGVTCWTFDDLAATVRDTFELGRIRGVTLERLGPLAQVLPLVQWGAKDDPAGTDDATWLDAAYNSAAPGGAP